MTMPENLQPGDARPLIPIVLGVVGHRKIPTDQQSLQALTGALDKVFADFDAAYPNSPKVLLSSLSPGANQLAAKVALDRKNWKVRVPLAFTPAQFLKSTSFRIRDENGERFDVAAQDEFKRLLALDRVEWFVVPLPPEKQPT